jgi:hypothetical protein
MKAKVIAYYLPQYHPFPENDRWWGKGFTEWTNVARALPLYKGHYQPKVPADLGFYDLRLPIIREEQAKLARESGVFGFCYWHYWFGNGKQLMADIFDEVLATGKPDFPFCLGWANHSWYAKNWNTSDTGKKDKLLIEQTYPGEKDLRMHYEYVLKAFKDHRYILQDGKPVFVIFAPQMLPKDYPIIKLWNQWAKEDGFLKGIYFIANYTPNTIDEVEGDEWLVKGFSAVIPQRLRKILLTSAKVNIMHRIYSSINRHIAEITLPGRYDYKDVYHYFDCAVADKKETVIPTLIPNFDHSPRSKRMAYILDKSTPDLFYDHCCRVFNNIEGKKNNLVWLRSWNEWGEGNYMEPDLKYGRGYIDALKRALTEKL